MPDGRPPVPGGWSRIQLVVDGAAAALTVLWRRIAGEPTPKIRGPYRLVLQVTALVILASQPALERWIDGRLAGLDAMPLLVVAFTTAAVAAGSNNLPASVLLASFIAPGPGTLAVAIGLAVGALATPQGSVATLIALEGTPPKAGSVRNGHVSFWPPAAAAAVAGAGLIAGMQGASG